MCQVGGFVATVSGRDPEPVSPFRLAAQPVNNYIVYPRATGPYWLDNSFSCQSTPPAGMRWSEFEIGI